MIRHEKKQIMKKVWEIFWEGLSVKKIVLILLGAAITSFGLYNIHQQCGRTCPKLFKETRIDRL